MRPILTSDMSNDWSCSTIVIVFSTTKGDMTMRIIKPYGRSHVASDAAKARRRVLRLRDGEQTSRDLKDFALTHNELLVAQWISAIDKIATKPNMGGGPTDEQRNFREKLGNAAWTLLVENKILSGLDDAKVKAHLTSLWKVKIAPYGADKYRPKRSQHGKSTTPPSAKGRWYDRFSNSPNVADVDVADVAQKIYEHLHVAEYRIRDGLPNRAKGRIAARAESITANVLKLKDVSISWSNADCETYAKAGDVAEGIKTAAKCREDGKDGAGTRRVTTNVAAPVLFAQYAKLFADDTGRSLSIAKARDNAPGLFNLHMAIKDCYSRLLKHHGKDQKAHGDRRRKISDILPDTMEKLFALVNAKTSNRNLNALVRLGKIIHYEASVGAEDSPANPEIKWPADISESIYWASDGQATIKRNEAFVRVWRHVLALASRTLTDWADPEGKINTDILLSEAVKEVTGNLFNPDNYLRKIELLFGNRADLFKGNGNVSFDKGILKFALEGTASLRHSAFHFKGLGGFTTALGTLGCNLDGASHKAVCDLINEDAINRTARLLKTLRGVHVEYFLRKVQGQKLLTALFVAELPSLPLPRFSRVLLRAKDAWENIKNGPRLPAPANRAALENAARLCQYTTLKLLYEQTFRCWLQVRDTATLNTYINRAISRADEAAKDLNASGDNDRRAIIMSRASILGHLGEGDTISTFFFNLSSETASEMRVQRGYESDSDAAREQASYIEDFKCEVVALAFDDFLKMEDFSFLVEISPDMPKPEHASFNLDTLEQQKTETLFKDWQASLYFLIHLVPVGDVGKLLHQIRKWEILAHDPLGTEFAATTHQARDVCTVLELYLDMHDAKFEGGAALKGCAAFKEFFEPEHLFDRIFPSQPDDADDGRIPYRGLREIMRFGHLPALRHIFLKHHIGGKEIAELHNAERADEGKSEIARWQEQREKLHEKWIREKKKFSGTDLRAYVEALSAVIRHRHLAAHVTLTDHVRLHRLLMSVLGRLVDFSGLWERDLYYVTLALIYRAGSRPDQVFDGKGLRYLREGQIIEALRNIQKNGVTTAIKSDLSRHFGPVFDKNNSYIGIRNGFAHFNMLKSAAPRVDLTACVNDARKLMSYDRKLKNVVSQSVAEMLAREGLTLSWTMDKTHNLDTAALGSRQARHLGKVKLFEIRKPDHGGRRPKSYAVLENLHSESFTRMVAMLFNGAAKEALGVADIPISRIDWSFRSD